MESHFTLVARKLARNAHQSSMFAQSYLFQNGGSGRNRKITTPLYLAVMLGNIDMINLLLKFGASMLLRDRNGNTVVHLAVKRNVEKDVLDLVLSHPDTKSVLNFLDYEGYSALHYAVLKNNETAVRCLHNASALMNVIDGKSGRSPLIHAILEHNRKMVSLLLECGASAEVVDYSGRTAFELALQSSTKEIVKLLEKLLFPDNPIEDISYEDPSSYKVSSNHSSNKRTRNERPTTGMKTRSSSKKSTVSDQA